MGRRVIVGIDCGVNGGIAIFKRSEAHTFSMPPTIVALEEALYHMGADGPLVYIEDVPPFAGANRPAARIFKLAENFGIIKGILTAHDISYKLVRPQVWMKKMVKKKRNEFASGNKWKNYLKQKAAICFPDVKPTLKTADALLILQYGIDDYDNGGGLNA